MPFGKASYALPQRALVVTTSWDGEDGDGIAETELWDGIELERVGEGPLEVHVPYSGLHPCPQYASDRPHHPCLL
jgi:hypothetical protein